MQNSQVHIRHCMLYEYQLGHSARAAAGNICRAIGLKAITNVTVSFWYKRFMGKDYELLDEPRSGRPPEIDLDRLQELLKSDPRYTTRCLASELGCSHTAIYYHLTRLGFQSLLGFWIPHDLTANQKTQRLDICMSLLSKKRHFGWLDDVITGDEKWVLYVNNTRKSQWLRPGERPIPTPKPELHPKKVMLSVWWGVRGVVYWELLPKNKTVTAEVYCAQLVKLKAQLESKHPQQRKVHFLHDNARPHVALVTRQKLMQFGWDVLPHPPYSPDLAPTDYHLFLSLSNKLRDQCFENEDDLKAFLTSFFDSHPPDFYKRGIHSLATRWQTVIDNNGAYITK